MIEQDATVYFQCPKNSWILGTVETWDGAIASCKPMDPKDGRDVVTKLKEHQVFVARDDIITEDVDDLLNLTVLHDSTLLNCLKRRYLRDVIYTNIGAIVVALNPFNFKIPWYMDDKMGDYLQEGEVIEKNLPHSWAVAHNTYFEMRNDRANQCVLVSGESGAGKTEASKIVMKYVAALSCKSGTEEQKERGRSVGTKINLTSAPLEAFGNAKTVRNDNSSRFGKFMQVKFDGEGFLVGAFITKYLLEKSRIVVAAENERVYHSLYIVVRGKDSTTYGVKEDKSFKILTSGKCLNNKEFDTAGEYDEVITAMTSIGIKQANVASMFAVVAFVLHMGNVSFLPDGEGSTINPETAHYVASAAKLIKIDQAVFEKELLTTTLSVAGQQITKVLNPTAATDAKEALMKSLYDCEFQWLVDQCNAILDVDVGSGNWIGLLDIFGFEDFEKNSFEQLCINLTNETLQGHYNDYIFNRDLEECKAEGIDMSMVEFPDNGPCIQMITAKGGILSLLDEECSLGKGSDLSFLAKITAACQDNSFFIRKILQKETFTVRHYAGDVTYDVTGWLDKNRDTLKDAFKLMCRASSDELVAQILPEPTEDKKKITVGGFFKAQLLQLMEVLNSTNPHWIRCVKPHPAKKPLMWHGINVMNQLSSSGVLGTVKIRKAGYPVRIKHADFLGRYNILGKSLKEILHTAKVQGLLAQIGTVRVFLKSEAYVMLEDQKKKALIQHARTVQAFSLAWKDLAYSKAQQREKNKSVIEKYRKHAIALVELQKLEIRERAAKHEQFLAWMETKKEEIAANLKELTKELRRLQVEKLREEYERKQLAEAARVERERKDRLKREAQQRVEEERAAQRDELQKLEELAKRAKAAKQQRELEHALATRTLMEQHLKEKADQMFLQRLTKREEDRKKAEAAQARRKAIETSQMKRLQKLHYDTELMVAKGETLKCKNAFEAQQEREVAHLKLEGRRRQVNQRLAEEREAREQDLLLQLAIAEARHKFHEAKSDQIQKDNSSRQHVHQIMRNVQEKEVAMMREAHQRREHAKTLAAREELDNVRSKIARFQQEANRSKLQLQQAINPIMDSFEGRQQTNDQVLHTQHLATVRKDLVSSAALACDKQKVTTLARDALKLSAELTRPLPEPIRPQDYAKLNCSKQGIPQQYGTAVLAERPMVSLPWRR